MDEETDDKQSDLCCFNLGEPPVLPEPSYVPWSLRSPTILDDGFSLLSFKLQHLHPHFQEVALLPPSPCILTWLFLCVFPPLESLALLLFLLFSAFIICLYFVF